MTDVVLTSVPQTAMTVLAEETTQDSTGDVSNDDGQDGNNLKQGGGETSKAEGDGATGSNTEDGNTSGEGATGSNTEGDNISGEGATGSNTEGDNISGEGATGSNTEGGSASGEGTGEGAENMGTPAVSTPENTIKTVPETESAGETVELQTIPLDSEPIDFEGTGEDKNNELDAVEGVGDPVSINIVYKEGDDEISEEVAEVIFTSGVDAGGNAIGGDPVAFHVNPNPGWMTDPTVETTIMKENATSHEMESVTLAKSGSAPNYSFSPNGTGTASKTFTGDITITITGTRVKHNLQKAAAAPTMYLVGTVGETVNPAIGEAPGIQNIPFDLFNEDAEIKVAIPKTEAAVTNKYGKLSANVAGSAPKTVGRNEGTENITPNGGAEVECVTFTFKPSDLTGYDASENANSTFELAMDTNDAAKTLTVKATSEATDLWKANKLADADVTALETADTSNAYKYYTLKDAYASLDGNDFLIDGTNKANKDNYRTTKNTGVTPNVDENNVLVFTVDKKDDMQVSIKKVWAELTIAPNKKVQELDASELTYTVSSTEKKCYAIDFTGINDDVFTEDMTMTIKAETEYNAEDTDEGFEVHNIKFTGDLDTVEIKEKDLTDSNFDNDENKELAQALTNQEPSFNFTIRPKTGYTISKGTDYNSGSRNTESHVVTISYDKKIKFTYNTKTYYINAERTEDKELSLTETNGIYTLEAALSTKASTTMSDELAGLAKEQNSDLAETDAATLESGASDISYSLKNIEINVKTELTKDQTGGVTVDCPADMSYEVNGTDVEKSIDDPNRYEIGEDADLVVLSITSEVVPTVSYTTGAWTSGGHTSVTVSAKDVISEAGTYTVKIPVSKLETNTNEDDVIDACITITKGVRLLDVDEAYNGAGAGAFTGEIEIEGLNSPLKGNYATKEDEDGSNDDNISIEDGRDITVTLTAQAGRLFDEVTYKVGEAEDAEAHEVTVSDDKTTATFSVKMTDKVTVNAKTSSTYKYVVKYGDASDKDAIPAGDGVYAIPAGVKKVQIKVYNGETGQNVETVKIYDGSETAAAKSAISVGDNSQKNTITLTLSEKDGELIRLELKGKRNNTGRLIELPSISIRQDKAAEEILITDEDGNKVESVNIVPGGSAIYDVSVVNGSLDFMEGNIKMEIARDASKQGNKSSTGDSTTQSVDYDNIIATYNHNTKKLTIEGKNVKKGNENPIILRFFDVKKRGKDETNKLGIVAGSEISVKLDSHAISGITPEVSAFNTVYNVQLVLSTPGYGVTEEIGNDIYYRINIKEKVDLPDGADNAEKKANIKEGSGTIPTALDAGNNIVNGNKTIYVKKTGESQEILLPINYQKKDGALIKAEKTFNLTVDLVHHMTREAGVDAWAEPNNLIASQAVTLATKTAKATYQPEMTLSTASATIYTGQEKQKIANASFGNGEGVCQLKTAIVDAKTGVSQTISGLKANAGVDGSIYVDASGMTQAVKNLPKNLGLKVSAYADEANEVSAIIKLNFKDGVSSIGFENGGTRVLYKEDGKAATMKLKAVFNENTGVKPKSKTLTCVLADENGIEISSDACKLSQNLRKNVSVSAKGEVKVSKDYVHDKDKCTFKVIAKCAGMAEKGVVTITISQTAQEMGDVVIVDENNRVVARDGDTLRKEDFYNTSLYVKVLKNSVAQTNNKFNANDYLEGVSITSGTKKSLAVSSVTGRLTMLGSSKKAVKITVVNADGSKKIKKTISVNLAGPSDLGAVIYDMDGNDVHHPQWGTEYSYSGSMKERFRICPVMYLGGKNGTWVNVPDDYYKNLNFKIKGGKKVTIKNESYFEVVKTAPVTTITISDKTDKNVEAVTYTIEQSPATPVKGKSLKITAPKLTQQMVDGARNAETQNDGTLNLKFQISGKNASEYAGMHILLTPDYTKTKLVNKIPNTEEYQRAAQYFLDNNQKAVKIDADGSFSIPLNLYRKSVQEVIPGTYKLIATVGNYWGGGVFEPVDGVKAATVSVKIPGKAPKTLTLQSQADYTLSTGGEPVDLAVGISSAFKWNVEGSNSNYAKNVVNEDGTTNNFRKYFRVYLDNGKFMLGMNDGLKAAELDELLKDETGKDLKGYVTITTKGVNSTDMETKDVLINVTLDQAAGLTAEANETYRGAEATVKIYSAGNSTASALAGVALDKSAGAQTGASATLGEVENGIGKSIKVKIPANAADTYEVALKVLTANSAYANISDAGTAAAKAEKYGDSVKVQIKVCDPATAVDVVEVQTSEDDLAFQALYTKTEYENSLSSSDKKNSYYDTSAKKYVVRVDVKSKIDGAKVTSAGYDKNFADKAVKNMLTVTKGNDDEILLTLDRAKFLKESAASETLKNGETVEIPVTVRFNLSGLKEETITLAVKLPNPPAFEEAKASMLAVESELANMQPDEYLPSDVTSQENLIAKLKAAFRRAVPLDTNATVSPFDPSENAEKKLAQKVTIQGTSADEKYEHDFTWDVPNSTLWTASGLTEQIKTVLKIDSVDAATWLRDEINALEQNKNAGVTVDNDYTADSFVKDLTAILANNKIALGSNLSVDVTMTNKKRATAGGAGSFTFTVKVSNSVDKADTSEPLEVKVNIPELTNLGKEGEAVEKALNGLDYEQAIYDAFENGDIDSLETNLADVIMETAKEALTNKSIEVELVNVTLASDEYGYSSDVNADNSRTVAFKLPDETNPGRLRYQVNLNLTGMKAYMIKRTDKNNPYGDSHLDGYITLSKEVVGKTGKDFQTINAIGGAAGALNDAKSGPDAVLTTWTEGTKTAEFKDKLEVKSDESEREKIESTVEELVGKIVTGMYLDVTATWNEATSTDSLAKGSVKVTDTKKRAKLDGSDSYEYEFYFEIGLLSEAGKESVLGTPTLVNKTVWDGDIKNAMNANQPAWDHVSGLTVGEPERIDAHTYRVSLGGTLKYVEGWTGFSSVQDMQSGYYAAISIPIPAALKTITDNDGNAANDYIQVAGDIERRFNGGVIKGEKGTLTLVQRMAPEANHSQIASGSISNVRGFKIVVDYDGLTGSAGSIATGTTAASNDSATVTYIFDASGVALDNSSEAEISFGATDSDIAALKSLVGISGDVNDEILLAGSNDGKSDVIRASGSLKKIEASSFNGVYTDENEGYYAVVTVKAPGNTATTGTGASTAGEETDATLKTFNPAVHGDGGHKKTIKFSSLAGHEDQFDTLALILRVNDENASLDKKSITFTVDWDGAADNWKEKTYTLDLSNVVYEKAQ